ncbi:MAG: FHA domain-containing protein, partial [Bacteroidaceae bacterium]|nr:FHA domain-containing protein [Bacteroidaceae bacterium]
MDIVIGRESGNRRLQVAANSKVLTLGAVGCVPLNVSRQHCCLSVLPNGNMSIQNLQARNVTYVDGVAVNKAQITKNSRVELGPDRYLISVNSICASLGISLAPVFSLSSLEPLWDEYDKERLRIQTEGQKSMNIQRLQGMISALGMLCFFIKEMQAYRFVCIAVSIA